MKRSAFLAAAIVVLSLAGTTRLGAQEKVKYVDHATRKEATVEGVIDKETPAGISIKVAGKPLMIPYADVVRVTYRSADVKSLDYEIPFATERQAFDPKTSAAERKKLLQQARAEFEKLATRMADNPKAFRYLLFRVALVKAELARQDTTLRDDAIAALRGFRTEHTAGWEIVPCLKLLAQLQEEKGDLAAAKETYKDLRALPDLPKEMKLEGDILLSQMLVRGNKYAEAEEALQSVGATLPDGDPQKATILVYLSQVQMAQGKTAEVEKNLQAAAGGTSDNTARAVAHNTLGDYYRQKKQDEDAFWEYLRVDVLYSQDKEEHAKALYYLSKLFETVKKDGAKAQACREKLKGDEFKGSEYQRRAATEK